MMAIIIVGMASWSSPKMLLMIGMPMMTKLLRKMAWIIAPRRLFDFSMRQMMMPPISAEASTPTAPNSMRCGRNVSARSVV